MATKLSTVLWLIAVAMLLALVPLWLVASNLRSEAARSNATLVPIRQSLAGLPTPLPDVQPLRESLARIQAQATQVQAIQATLEGQCLEEAAKEYPELKAALEAWVEPFKGMGM